jgi:hypothetical protein
MSILSILSIHIDIGSTRESILSLISVLTLIIPLPLPYITTTNPLHNPRPM